MKFPSVTNGEKNLAEVSVPELSVLKQRTARAELTSSCKLPL